ncbi:phosphotransferase family protein [Demequina sp.]|uniref:phosphotransferase family protein n=1 Tax=Demequina sp. TaxID=2050685 RepID=UPI003A8B929E
MDEWAEGTEIARGATAVVSRGAPGTVVKTLLPGFPTIILSLEATAMQAAHAAGLPVPALLEARLEADPPCLVMSYAEGTELADLVPALGPVAVGEILADVQHQVRGVSGPDAMVTVHDYVGSSIGRAPIGEQWREAAVAELRALPDGQTLCHFDRHPRNILWDGQPTIIDWNNGVQGHPAADVSRTRIVVGGSIHYVPDEHRAAVTPALGLLLKAFERRTEELAPGLIAQSRAWDAVVSVMRLDDSPPQGHRSEIRAFLAARWGESPN